MVDNLSKNPSKSRILIVEDDKSIRETLREALVAEGYAVEVCKTGDEAQTRIFSQFDTSKKLDLVVLDLMLPNLNGIELCRRVRKNNIKKIYSYCQCKRQRIRPCIGFRSWSRRLFDKAIWLK